MALRMTGMNSGLDTESLIQELVSARRKKVDTKTKEQTKLQWKQDAWKDLNTKLKNLQSKFLSNMRFSSAYSKKTTKVSNSSAASVITGENAVNGVQSLQIKQLAKTAYLTGGKIENESGELNALSKLSDVDGLAGMSDGRFAVKAGGKSVEIQVTADTTISDVLNKLKDAGLNANFDAKQQRFFVSAKESGANNDFSITAIDANGSKVLQELGLQTDLSKDSVAQKEYSEYSKYYVAGDKDATLANMRSIIDKDVASRTATFVDRYKELVKAQTASNDVLSKLDEKYQGKDPLGKSEDYKALLDAKNEEIATKKKEMRDLSGSEKEKAEEELKQLQDEAKDLSERQADASSKEQQEANLAKYADELSSIGTFINVTGEGEDTLAEATDKLIAEVEDAYYSKAQFASDVMNDSSLLKAGATKINGQDSLIILNDAEFTSDTNNFEINGLTITALNETKDGESITITTEQDTDGIYDMVKNFLKEYNSLINEMDKLYNAESAKGFEPLTSEEKSALSETEVSDYEKKIKDALLRRDEGVNTISSSMRSLMADGVTVNGKKMYLSDFGIDMLSYFSAPDNEKHAYHIDGDADDASTSGNADKLKTMISNDPSTVISFFTKLSQNLYDKMSDMSKSVDGYRSFGNFYDDKRMAADYADYKTKIAEMEQKVNDYEDNWYKKFSKMETALAKMQSSATALSGLFGSGN